TTTPGSTPTSTPTTTSTPPAPRHAAPQSVPPTATATGPSPTTTTTALPTSPPSTPIASQSVPSTSSAEQTTPVQSGGKRPPSGGNPLAAPSAATATTSCQASLWSYPVYSGTGGTRTLTWKAWDTCTGDTPTVSASGSTSLLNTGGAQVATGSSFSGVTNSTGTSDLSYGPVTVGSNYVLRLPSQLPIRTTGPT